MLMLCSKSHAYATDNVKMSMGFSDTSGLIAITVEVGMVYDSWSNSGSGLGRGWAILVPFHLILIIPWLSKFKNLLNIIYDSFRKQYCENKEQLLNAWSGTKEITERCSIVQFPFPQRMMQLKILHWVGKTRWDWASHACLCIWFLPISATCHCIK